MKFSSIIVAVTVTVFTTTRPFVVETRGAIRGSWNGRVLKGKGKAKDVKNRFDDECLHLGYPCDQ